MSKALIVGVGEGLSASLARQLSERGHDLVLAARRTDKLAGLQRETGARSVACDASRPEDVETLFRTVDGIDGELAVVVYNPSFRVRGPLVELAAEDVMKSLEVTAFGAFLTAREAVRRMLPAKAGAILFTGASAGVKGYPRSAPFAMGKFALRGLAQSMARELHPQGIHVGHVVIDGAIRNPGRTEPADRPGSMLDPDRVAETYMQLIDQDRSVWSWEIEVRPWVESF